MSDAEWKTFCAGKSWSEIHRAVTDKSAELAAASKQSAAMHGWSMSAEPPVTFVDHVSFVEPPSAGSDRTKPKRIKTGQFVGTVQNQGLTNFKKLCVDTGKMVGKNFSTRSGVESRWVVNLHARFTTGGGKAEHFFEHVGAGEQKDGTVHRGSVHDYMALEFEGASDLREHRKRRASSAPPTSNEKRKVFGISEIFLLNSGGGSELNCAPPAPASRGAV